MREEPFPSDKITIAIPQQRQLEDDSEPKSSTTVKEIRLKKATTYGELDFKKLLNRKVQEKPTHKRHDNSISQISEIVTSGRVSSI